MSLLLSAVSGVAKAVPFLKQWLGGDNSKAKTIIELAKKITGESANASALAKIEGDTTLQLRLMAELKKVDLEFYQLQLGDVQHARNTHVQLQQGKSKIAREFIYWYAGIVTLLTFVYIFAITFITLPETAESFANTCLGFLLGTAFGGLVNFFYGSSKPVKDDE